MGPFWSYYCIMKPLQRRGARLKSVNHPHFMTFRSQAFLCTASIDGAIVFRPLQRQLVVCPLRCCSQGHAYTWKASGSVLRAYSAGDAGSQQPRHTRYRSTLYRKFVKSMSRTKNWAPPVSGKNRSVLDLTSL